jgi:CheY-like chemotaxis protein
VSRSTAASAGAKPRVFLVDDHQGILETLSAMLADDFDVVGRATDGRQALELVPQANPDVIVLDVNMPGLDGFQTARALQRTGLPPTPVVFLSMFPEDEYVGEAFQCGGFGYVLKPRLRRDLIGAIDQALNGSLFVPSLTPLLHLPDDRMHAMQTYGDVESFLDGLAVFFERALRRGDATCLIGTRPVREGVGARLRRRGFDVNGPTGHKRYLVIDAADALDRFMRNGLPDARCVAEIAVELDAYRRAAGEGPAPRLTVFGNTVVPLCEDGNPNAALALEHLWNTVTEGLPILTLCGWAASCFHDGVPNLRSDASTAHRALSHASEF